jgi:hypothetical protein
MPAGVARPRAIPPGVPAEDGPGGMKIPLHPAP